MTDLGTLEGTNYRKFDGSVDEGSVFITTNIAGGTLRDPAGNVIWSGSLEVPIVDGTFNVDLPPTDDDTLSADGFVYIITERLKSKARVQWRVSTTPLPGGTVVNMADLASGNVVPPSPDEEPVTLSTFLALQAEVAELPDNYVSTDEDGNLTIAGDVVLELPVESGGTVDYPAAQRVSRPALKSTRLVNVGSSIGSSGSTGLDGGDTVVIGANSYVVKAQQLLQGRFDFVNDGGVPSQTSTVIRSQFAVNVTAHTPGIVFLSGDRYANDANTDVVLATVQTNEAADLTAVAGIGAQAVVSTCPPRTAADDDANVLVTSYNEFIRSNAKALGIPLVDFHAALTDPDTGYFFDDFTDDGLHPNSLGYAVMAACLADTLDALLPPGPGWVLTTVNNGAGNLVKNGQFIGGPVGVPGEWILQAAGTGTITAGSVRVWHTPSRHKLRLDIVAGTGSQGGVLQILDPQISAGRRVRITGKISVSGDLTAIITGAAQSGTTTSGQFRVAAPATDLPFSFEYAASGSNQWVTIYGAPGTGSVEVSDLEVRALPIELADTFTRANSASTVGATEVGTKTPAVVGTWGISGNQLYPVSAAAGDTITWDLGDDDQEVTWVIGALPAASQIHGPLLRFVDASNHYRTLLGTTGNFVMFKYDAVNGFAVMFNANFQFAVGDQIRVRCVGGSVRAWKNGVEIGSGYTDATPLTGTKVGYIIEASGAGSVRLDNFHASLPVNL